MALFGLWWMYRVDVSYGWGMVLALISSFCVALFGTLNSVEPTGGFALFRASSWRWAGPVLGLMLLATGEWSASWPGPSDWGWLPLGLIATSMAFAITVEVMRS